MSCEFWLGVAQTTIGSTLGFALGIGAFHYQQHLQSKTRNMGDWRAALDALNRLNIAAGVNIEALANSKLQFINDMRPEVEQMKAASIKVYDAPRSEQETQVAALKTLSESLLHFYMSLPRTSVMLPPAVDEYSSLSKDMPALATFVHRAMEMMRELNEHIKSRNALVAEHAREGGMGAGMTSERLIYYSSMLAGEGRAIFEQTDFALDFWRLVLDQIETYMTVKARGEHFLQYRLVPKAEEAMPREELFPLMREQLMRFDG